MMHAKTYLCEKDNAEFSAYIGSQNITSYVLKGLNSEAGTQIRGHISDEQYKVIDSALSAIRGEI